MSQKGQPSCLWVWGPSWFSCSSGYVGVSAEATAVPSQCFQGWHTPFQGWQTLLLTLRRGLSLSRKPASFPFSEEQWNNTAVQQISSSLLAWGAPAGPNSSFVLLDFPSGTESPNAVTRRHSPCRSHTVGRCGQYQQRGITFFWLLSYLPSLKGFVKDPGHKNSLLTFVVGWLCPLS